MEMRRVMRRLVVLGLLLSLMGHARYVNAVSPRQLVGVVDFSAPLVSPDGELVAFRVEQASIERNTYDSAWYVQDINGLAPPLRVADGGVPLRGFGGSSLPADVVWSMDSRWIYYRALLEGRVEIWRASADGSMTEAVTHDPADVRDFLPNPSGRVLKYAVGASREMIANAEQREYDLGIRIDESVPIGQGLFRSGYNEARFATQRYGDVWFERTGLLSGIPLRWKEVDLLSGVVRDLGTEDSLSLPNREERVFAEAWKSASDPVSDRIVVLTRVGRDDGLWDKPDVELGVISPGNAHRMNLCTAALCAGKAFTGIQWRPDTDEVLATITDPDLGLAQSIIRWNVLTNEVHSVVESRGLVNGGRDVYADCGVSAQVLVCVSAEADRPPRVERIDIETGERRTLFDPNAALAFDIARIAPAELLRWSDAMGRRFTGQFFRARGDAPTPLFITYYSCPGFVRGGIGDEWPLVSMVEKGISALCINSLPSYTLDAVERHDEGLHAVRSVVDMLANEGKVDRTKIGMGGLSYGGAVALWAATDSDLLAAASVSSPVVSPNYYLFASLKGEAFFSGLKKMWGLGAPDETPERWRRISPAFKLDRVTAPVLFQMSEQEYMNALDYAIPLMRGLRADMYVFPHEPHIKFQPRHLLAVYERNLDWFRFWLQGVEDEDASKESQYRHWRLMKVSAPVRSRLGGESGVDVD